MKKFFTLILVCFASVSLWAYDFESDGLYYNITGNYEVKVTYQVWWNEMNYAGLTTITIPETVNYNGTTYSVTSIGGGAFYGCSSLTSITIPNSVTSIESSAFSNCSGLTSINIPSSVTSIGNSVFTGSGIYKDQSNWENDVFYIDDCLLYAKNTLSGAYTIKPNTRVIADYAFQNCSSLTSITIPNTVQNIGSTAFYDLVFLEENFINNSHCTSSNNWGAFIVNEIRDGLWIADHVVVKCTSDASSIAIPNTVTCIGKNAFRNCQHLTSITIPNSVMSIKDYAFYDCSALTSITIPNSVTSIGYSAFSNCSALTSVTIPNSVTNFDAYIFSYCSALKSVTLPDNMTSIRYGMFYTCASLDSITIPNSVTSIESSAFSSCSALTSITIPNSVQSIGSYAFAYCDALTSITIPNSVTSIEDYAFYSCENLASITFAYDTYCTIGASAFESCKNLRIIYNNSNLMSFTTGSTEQGYVAYYAYNISSSLNYQGDFVFDNGGDIPTLVAYHGNATSLTLPNSYNGNPYHLGTNFLVSKSLYDNYNYDYTYDIYDNYGESTTVYVSVNDEVQSIKVPASVISLAPFAFSGETAYGSYNVTGNVHLNIQSVQFDRNSSITEIPSSAFYNCSYLQEILLPDSLITIGSYAFYGCNDLVSITIPDNVTSIGNNAFQYCSSLTSITIPNSVTSIGSSAFMYCSSLTSITIPNSVTSIGSSAFSSCSALTSVTIPNSVTSIGSSAFSSCSALTSVTIPNSVTSIGSSAFSSCNALESIIVEEGNAIYDSRENCNAIIETKTNTLLVGCQNTTIPNSVTSIGESAFYSCDALSSITIPNSVKSIGNYAFNNSSDVLLFESEVPATIGQYSVFGSNTLLIAPNADTYKAAWTQYKDQIFARSAAIVEVSTTAHTEKSALHQELGLDAFQNIVCLKINGTINSYDIMMLRNQMPLLRELDLSDASIEANTYEYAKGYCSKNDTLTSQAFTGTGTKITKMILPKSLKYIEVGVFNSNLAHLTILGGKLANAAFEKSNIRSITLSDDVKEIAPSAFKNCYYLKQVNMGNGVQTIGSSAFQECNNLRSIIMGNGVQTIGSSAFQECNNLRSIIIGNGVQTIGSSSFYKCSKLGQISMGDNVQTIGSSAFYSCNNLSSITLSNNLRKIDENAFYACSALQAITLPESLETIGKYAFQGTGFRAITIPANVSSLGVGAFAGNNSTYYYKDYYTNATSNNTSSYRYYNGGSLREVTIPKESKLKTIPSSTFEGNESLTKLSILGDSITSIADVAFLGCALDTLILPPNLTSLSTLSFGYCTGLKFIAMPNSLTEISANAFVGCTNLNDIQFPRKLTHIGHHAFANCRNLSNVDIPGLVTSIGDYAFKDCNVNSVYSYLFDPFTIGQNTFSAYANANAILYVPNLEDTEMKYLYDTQWSQFLHRVRMDKDFEYDDFYANGDVVIGDQDDPLNGDPNANLNPGSGLVVEGDSTQNLGTVILTGEPGDWASILAGCNLNVDTLILQLKVTGHQWHFFGFPFEIKISDIFTEGNFVIYEYDGAIRAERDTTGWKKLPTGQDCLYPGHGYIFQFDFAVDGYFSIKLNKPNFCKLVELINLFIYPASNPHNQSWNYVSNPLLAYYDINDLNYTGPITFWDELLETYQTYRPGDDEYYISPYEAFFLQNANLNDNFALFFDRNKAMTKKQRDERINSKHHLPAKKTDEPARERFLINLLISDGTYSDQTRVVINSNASLDYELGVDAAKFLSTEKVPQLFSYDADHAMCAINERPMDNGTVQLGIQLPKSGTYSISAARMDTTFYLFDKQENITHDFQQGDYYFDAKSGLNDQRFELVRTPKRVPTAIEDINTTTITPTADGLIVEGNDYIQIYSMTGVMMAEGQLSGLVQLPNGVYVVVCNGNATKHTVQ